MIRPGSGGRPPIPREVVDRLYEQARRLDPGARAAFVKTATRETAELRDEVLSLLGEADAAEKFFECLSDVMPARAPHASSPDLSIGLSVGHYEILKWIDSGGMGTVYRARDTRLERDVALKFLPPHLTSSPEARERLLVEARAAAALEHPNVCTVYEIGETADGRAFIAMALCLGETLKERLERGPLPPEDAIMSATQIARGLAAAHARGIVHRDVKPGNVMLAIDGTVKLLDFGLAKLADVTLTSPGIHPGTIAYMSPEQVRGDVLDPRTDLWSLGVVLYEMLAGVRPFRGGSDRLVRQAILEDDPPPVSTVRPEVPSRLGQIVARLLRKEREERYGSAVELLAHLDPAQSGSRAVGDVGFRRRWMPETMSRRVALVAAGVIAALAFLGVRAIRDPDALVPATVERGGAAPAIAVLPFSAHGEEVDVWREGMVDLLSMGLDGAGGLRVIDNRTLLARWNESVGNRAADLDLALEIARQTQASYAVVGSVVAAGSQLRFAADVYDLESGRPLGQAVAEGSPDSIFALVDRIAMQTLAIVFQEDPDDLPAIDLAAVTTTSLPALKAYLDGEVHFRRTELPAAIEAWEKAIRADTLFALAYYGLAEAYAWDEGGNLGNPGRGREMLDRAHRLADRLPALEAALVRTKSSRWNNEPGSVAAVEAVASQYPDVAEAWYNLAEAYHHQPQAMRGPEETERAFRRAAELQPASALYRAHLLDLAFLWQPDSARVAREVGAYVRLAPQAARARAGRVAFALAYGDPAARARAREEVDSLDPEAATQTFEFLRHPQTALEREALFPAIDRRVEDSSRWIVRMVRFHGLGTTDGRVRRALATLDDPGTPDVLRHCGPLHLSSRGLPVPEAILEERLAATRAARPGPEDKFWISCAAGYAAERGRWREYADLLARTEEIVRREVAAGDSASARQWQRALRAVEAHGLWRRGQTEEALRAFESALGNDNFGWRVLWLVGRLSYELGRLDQAERVFRSLWYWDGPPAQLYLGRIYERKGRTAEALEAHRFVLEAWRNADPELEPLIDEARRAVTRLSVAEN
ncbi:MAG TPA: protein kinase [Gemmatimonadota bacterium]|nr:protein kinase [Gemmatimonadota bacterium]